jgi:hypothetical protein
MEAPATRETVDRPDDLAARFLDAPDRSRQIVGAFFWAGAEHCPS